MGYDTALTTSLIDAILDSPRLQQHPELKDWECAYCLAPVREDGACNHSPQCLVTKARALKATYRHVARTEQEDDHV